MLILFSKFVGLPVIELENQLRVATTHDIVVEPKSGKVLGFLVKTGGLMPKEQLVSSHDLAQLLPTALLIHNADKVTEIDEVIRIEELYKKRFGLISKRVRTKSGKHIGRVEDFLISTDSMMLFKLYLRHMFSDRIIPFTAIIKIDQREIIVKDDFEALSATSQSEASTEAELA